MLHRSNPHQYCGSLHNYTSTHHYNVAKKTTTVEAALQWFDIVRGAPLHP